MYQHLRETRSDKRKNTYFHNALKKYGFENFEFVTIDEAETEDELNEKECKWISYYDSTNKEYGYNLDSGGKNCSKSTETKEKISACKKELWKNPDVARRMTEGLRKGNETWINTCISKRIRCICEYCGKEFTLPLWESKKRRYCSQACANHVNIRKATDAARIANIRKSLETSTSIEAAVKNWALEHKREVMECPMNKVSTVLQPLCDEINEEFGIKDIRSIANRITGSMSKKNFILYLQDYVAVNENICRSGLN